MWALYQYLCVKLLLHGVSVLILKGIFILELKTTVSKYMLRGCHGNGIKSSQGKVTDRRGSGRLKLRRKG